jgi:hypothetical protein
MRPTMQLDAATLLLPGRGVGASSVRPLLRCDTCTAALLVGALLRCCTCTLVCTNTTGRGASRARSARSCRSCAPSFQGRGTLTSERRRAGAPPDTVVDTVVLQIINGGNEMLSWWISVPVPDAVEPPAILVLVELGANVDS